VSVRIRLKRVGSKNRPQWRVVVSDSRSPRDGRFIEEIGHYDPLPAEEVFEIKEDRLQHWTEQGAKPTDVIKSLLKRSKKKNKS